MSYVRRKRPTAFLSIRHPAAEDEARRLIAKYDGIALRLVENRLDQQLATGDVGAALHLDQVRHAISKANVEMTTLPTREWRESQRGYTGLPECDRSASRPTKRPLTPA